MDYLNLLGLQGMAAVIGIVTLIKLFIEKVLFIYSLSDFDKILIPKNKVKIYESIKFIFSIIFFNLLMLLMVSSYSSFLLIPKKNIEMIQYVLGQALSISLFIFIFLSFYVKVKNKISNKVHKKKQRKIIEDSTVLLVAFFINISFFMLFCLSAYYQAIVYKSLNNLSVNNSTEILLVFTVISLIYILFILQVIKKTRENRSGQTAFRLITDNSDNELYVLQCKEDNVLILGEAKSYEESKIITLYYMKEERYTKFEKVL